VNAAGRPRRALGAVLLAAAAAVLLAGCSYFPRAPFQLTLPEMNGDPPLPIRLIDHSNTITAVEVPTRDPGRPGGSESDDFAVAVPGRSNAVFLVWLGGRCDEQVDIEYTGGDRTFTLTTQHGQGGCRLIGVIRSVIVVFGSPVDAATFKVQELR
jgi:hypothetical protein